MRLTTTVESGDTGCAGAAAAQFRDLESIGSDASSRVVTVQELVASKRDAILEIAHRHGAQDVRVFGSVARGEATENSDVDLLVQAPGPTSPWFPAGLVEELEALIGRRVQVVTEPSLNWLLRRRILREARPL
jgi:hypothetical protein